MAKYSFELKKKIVLEYLNEEVGYTTLAQKYGIPAIKSIETWVYNYNTFGDKGLFRSRKNGTYSFDKEAFCCRIIYDNRGFISTARSAREHTQSVANRTLGK